MSLKEVSLSTWYKSIYLLNKCNLFIDPRNDEQGFIGLGSPFPVLGVIACYVYFVKILGPKIMENRKPYDLSKVIYVYNIFQVFLNLYIGSVVSVNALICLSTIMLTLR